MVIVWTMIICERIGMWASELPAKRCICCNYICQCFINKLLETREWWSTFTFSNCGTETSLVLMDKIRPTSWHSKCYTCPYLSHSLQWCEGLSINNSSLGQITPIIGIWRHLDVKILLTTRHRCTTDLHHMLSLHNDSIQSLCCVLVELSSPKNQTSLTNQTQWWKRLATGKLAWQLKLAFSLGNPM